MCQSYSDGHLQVISSIIPARIFLSTCYDHYKDFLVHMLRPLQVSAAHILCREPSSSCLSEESYSSCMQTSNAFSSRLCNIANSLNFLSMSTHVTTVTQHCNRELLSFPPVTCMQQFVIYLLNKN